MSRPAAEIAPQVDAAPDARPAAMVVEGLKRRFGDIEAVRGIDFQVKSGEIFGFLGPNGVGCRVRRSTRSSCRSPVRRSPTPKRLRSIRRARWSALCADGGRREHRQHRGPHPHVPQRAARDQDQGLVIFAVAGLVAGTALLALGVAILQFRRAD